MSLQRITTLTEPAVVGRYYLVPTVLYPWFNKEKRWPVFLPRHEDKEHLNFEWFHYHVDPRFLTAPEVRFVAKARATFFHNEVTYETACAAAQVFPLQSRDFGHAGKAHDGHGSLLHPKPVWARKRCANAAIPYAHGHREPIKAMRDHYGGTQCKKGRVTGWVCPHRRFPLGASRLTRRASSPARCTGFRWTRRPGWCSTQTARNRCGSPSPRDTLPTDMVRRI